MCFAYCHIAYISPGSCKDCIKEPPLPPPPPPRPSSHAPLRVYYTFALCASGHKFSFFSHPPFSILFHKRGCGFLAAMLVNSTYKGPSPPSKRIDNAELFWDIFPENNSPRCIDFPCFVSADKSKIVWPTGMTVWIVSTSQMFANFSWFWKH